MNDLFIDIIGWVGAAAVIIAYALVSSKRLEGSSTVFQALNLMGGAFLIANTIYYGAFPSAFINIVWVGIAVFSLSKKFKVGFSIRKS